MLGRHYVVPHRGVRLDRAAGVLVRTAEALGLLGLDEIAALGTPFEPHDLGDAEGVIKTILARERFRPPLSPSNAGQVASGAPPGQKARLGAVAECRLMKGGVQAHPRCKGETASGLRVLEAYP